MSQPSLCIFIDFSDQLKYLVDAVCLEIVHTRYSRFITQQLDSTTSRSALTLGEIWQK